MASGLIVSDTFPVSCRSKKRVLINVNRRPRQPELARCSSEQTIEISQRRIEYLQVFSFNTRRLTPFEHMRRDNQKPGSRKVGGKRKMRVVSATRWRSIRLVAGEKIRKEGASSNLMLHAGHHGAT